MADLSGQQLLPGEQVLEVLRGASEGLFIMSETDAPIEPFFWPAKESEEPTSLFLASHVKIEVASVKTRSLTAFFRSSTLEQDWHNEQRKAEVKRFQALLETVKSNLQTPKVFRVGKVEIDVYVVGQVSDGYAGFKTMVVET